MAEPSMFLKIPVEVRMLIYEHLLGAEGRGEYVVRNLSRHQTIGSIFKVNQRSSYHVLEPTIVGSSYQTTYSIEGSYKIHPGILAVNRRVREEASHYLYGMHSFHFGYDLGAVVPFFEDKTDATRHLVREITLNKRGPTSMIGSDSCDWAAICRYLKGLSSLRKLTLLVDGGQPRCNWEGPRELSVSDLRLLYSTRHGSLEWVRDLAQVNKVGQVEIVAQMRPMSEPKTNEMLTFAALSASIETSLVEFLRTELNIPASSSCKSE